jgi:hypothetical protein
MFYLSDETAIKLHTAPDGDIWYATGINLPENSKQPLATFLLSPIIAKLNTNVRVIGVAQNAELISNLYLRKRNKELANICIAGPNICTTQNELNNPITTIFRMRDVWLPLACGGWHEMSDADYCIYTLLTRQRKTGVAFDNVARIFYETHPINAALNFIGGISHTNTAALLTTIVDPRWYVDRRRFDNVNKLNLYLGLTPRVQRRVSDTAKIIRRGRDFRCSCVLRCWKTQDPECVDFEAPNNFLWRIWLSAGGGSSGDLRASQAFIHYLYTNWLDVISLKCGAHDGFFLPEKFFKSAEEHAAFAQHFA